MATPKALAMAAAIVAGVTLVVSMVLGYSGSTRLAAIANGIFLLGLLLAVVLGVVSLVVRAADRKTP